MKRHLGITFAIVAVLALVMTGVALACGGWGGGWGGPPWGGMGWGGHHGWF